MLSRQNSLLPKLSSHLPKLTGLNAIQHRYQGGFTPADMPIIKRKWEAAEKVGKICLSMKNVAAGALPGAERHLSNARPFGLVTVPLFEVESEPDTVEKVLHIPIGTERGMCGAISSNTVRQCGLKIQDQKNLSHSVVTYGKRSSAVANTLFGENLLFTAGEVKTRAPTFEFCCQLAEYILYETEFDKIVLYYNEYQNAGHWSHKEVTLYKSEIAQLIADLQFPSYEIEAEEATIIDNLIEFKLASILFLSMAENVASEQASRLRSMDSASKNCNEMVQEYERIYQGLRKSKITNELIILAVAGKLASQKK